ncbi:MAG: hypothetical protein ACREUQ_00700, partial [Burkholderiales bacterium]
QSVGVQNSPALGNGTQPLAATARALRRRRHVMKRLPTEAGASVNRLLQNAPPGLVWPALWQSGRLRWRIASTPEAFLDSFVMTRD